MYRVVSMGLGVADRCVIFLTVVCLVIFWGCAAVAETKANPETAVTKAVEGKESLLKTRVQEYWKYKIERDFEKCYLYESPEYRQKVKFVRYLKSFGSGAEWLGVEVVSVGVAGDQGTVWVKVNYKWSMIPTNKTMTSSAKEEWKWMNNTWFHVKKAKGRLKDRKPELQKQLENSKGGEERDSINNKN